MSNAVAIKVSISLPNSMQLAADQRRRQLGYSSFSAYVQYLVARDLIERPAHVRQELSEAELSAITNAVVAKAAAAELRPARTKPRKSSS